jgi:hypothetical protein
MISSSLRLRRAAGVGRPPLDSALTSHRGAGGTRVCVPSVCSDAKGRVSIRPFVMGFARRATSGSIACPVTVRAPKRSYVPGIGVHSEQELELLEGGRPPLMTHKRPGQRARVAMQHSLIFTGQSWSSDPASAQGTGKSSLLFSAPAETGAAEAGCDPCQFWTSGTNARQPHVGSRGGTLVLKWRSLARWYRSARILPATDAGARVELHSSVSKCFPSRSHSTGDRPHLKRLVPVDLCIAILK